MAHATNIQIVNDGTIIELDNSDIKHNIPFDHLTMIKEHIEHAPCEDIMNQFENCDFGVQISDGFNLNFNFNKLVSSDDEYKTVSRERILKHHKDTLAKQARLNLNKMAGQSVATVTTVTGPIKQQDDSMALLNRSIDQLNQLANNQ